MANDFAARAVTAGEVFRNKLANSHSSWRDLIEVDTTNATATSLEATDMTGLGAFAAQAASGDAPAAKTLKTSGTAYKDTLYEQRTLVTEHDYQKNPNIFSEIAAMQSDGAIKTINSLVWSGFATLDTTAHPDQSITGAGATPYVADVFSAPVAQSTKLTAALGASALEAAMAELMSHQNKDGIPIDPTSAPMFLVVPTGLKQTALNLVGRTAEIYNGTALESGNFAGLDASRVLVNLDVTDANDWGLFAKGFAPFKFWLTQKPTFRVQPFPGAGRFEVYSSVAGGLVYFPSMGGFVFSKVA